MRLSMRPSSFTSTGRALYRVFVCPGSLTFNTAHASSRLPHIPSPKITLPQRRTIYAYAKPVKSDSQSTNPLSDPAHPLDEAIATPFVHLINPDGTLSRRQPLAKLLNTFDRTTHKLRQVALDPTDSVPICKIVTEKSLWEERRLKEKPKKGVADLTKQVELNWAADPNDVEHRVKKLQEFLREGRRVEVLLAPKPKRRGRQATAAEIEEILVRIRAGVAEVEGAEEWKEMDGLPGAQSVLYFRARDGAVTGVKKVPTMAERRERLAKKEAEKEERRVKQEKRASKAKEEKEQQEKLLKQMEAEL